METQHEKFQPCERCIFEKEIDRLARVLDGNGHDGLIKSMSKLTTQMELLKEIMVTHTKTLESITIMDAKEAGRRETEEKVKVQEGSKSQRRIAVWAIIISAITSSVIRFFEMIL